ncbi:MAG: hypothetical protein K2X93_21005 [Candidatus Obscuribacterales bacterium]|nr:hypothetical protein [Candidatus Obscuribacterales bacterium]
MFNRPADSSAGAAAQREGVRDCSSSHGGRSALARQSRAHQVVPEELAGSIEMFTRVLAPVYPGGVLLAFVLAVLSEVEVERIIL